MRRLPVLAGAASLLILLLLLSLTLGAKSIAPAEVWQALTGHCQGVDCTIIRQSRLPRTLAGLLAGMALGLSGALMQTLTRNPLADPGLLGVNAGAGFAVVLGIVLFGVASPAEWLGLAFGGALLSALLVAVTGMWGGRASPVRLTLAGVALGAVLEGITSGLTLLNPDLYDVLRFWSSGSLDIRQLSMLHTIFPAIALGTLLALAQAGALNSLSMGDDLAAALGTPVRRTLALGLIAIALLCGAATAAVGPIAFVGLMTPHLARGLLGQDHRWWLPGTLLLTPCLLLTADIIGRVLVPGELRVSVVTAILGAPLLIVLVRREMGRRC